MSSSGKKIDFVTKSMHLFQGLSLRIEYLFRDGWSSKIKFCHEYCFRKIRPVKRPRVINNKYWSIFSQGVSVSLALKQDGFSSKNFGYLSLQIQSSTFTKKLTTPLEIHNKN